MSQYFDALNSAIATIFTQENYIEKLIEIEEEVIGEVDLVTGDLSAIFTLLFTS